MTGAGFALFVFGVVLLGLGLTVGLYVLVRAEGADGPVVDRAEAERLARRDADEEE